MPDPRVLLVDDETDFVEALSARLEVRGMQVDSAASGAEAIAKVKDRRFDAIVLDLAMPGMDGIETLRELRAILPEVQVILLTGQGSVKQGIEAMKLGAVDFLEKPVSIDVLLAKIGEAKSTGDDLAEQKTDQLLSDIIGSKGW
jgi:two-component system OmpR family response regulator